MNSKHQILEIPKKPHKVIQYQNQQCCPSEPVVIQRPSPHLPAPNDSCPGQIGQIRSSKAGEDRQQSKDPDHDHLNNLQIPQSLLKTYMKVLVSYALDFVNDFHLKLVQPGIFFEHAKGIRAQFL